MKLIRELQFLYWQNLARIDHYLSFSPVSKLRGVSHQTQLQLLLSAHMAAVIWLLCHQYAGDILLHDFILSRSRWYISLFSLNLAKTDVWMRISWGTTWQEEVWGARCEEIGKTSNPSCSCKLWLQCHSPTVTSFANEFAHFFSIYQNLVGFGFLANEHSEQYFPTRHFKQKSEGPWFFLVSFSG